MKVSEFLTRYFDNKELLVVISESYGLHLTGTKATLVERIAAVPGFHAADVLQVLRKDDLKDICFDLGLPVSGTVDELIHRISKSVRLSDRIRKPAAKSKATPAAAPNKAGKQGSVKEKWILMIANGQSAGLIKELLVHHVIKGNDEMHKTIVLLSNRFETNKAHAHRGTAKHEDFLSESSRINLALMDFVKGLGLD